MTFESVDYGDEDEATVPEPADSWYDDAPITDEQIEAVRAGLGDGTEGAVYYQFSRAVVRKLLAEIDRLNTVLDANRVVRNAAESSCRTLKGVVHLLKTERTQLRSELADARGAMEILRSSGKEQCTRAETAERELAEMRERIEWGVRWTDQYGETHDDAKADEDKARQFVQIWRKRLPEYEAVLICRTKAGEWKPAEQQPEDAAVAPTAQPRCGTVRWGRRSKGGDRG